MGVKCSVFVAASVDGFIALPDGDVSWLENPSYTSTQEGDFGYSEFIRTVDAIIMGRHTFEKTLTFASWPYDRLPTLVLSSRLPYIPPAAKGKAEMFDLTPSEAVKRLHLQGKRHIYVDGANTIQRFLNARLIQEITITRVPVILGSGISLFGSKEPGVPLDLVSTKTFKNGFVQSTYRVVNSSHAV